MIASPLLGGQRATRGPNRLRLQGLVQPRVRTVLWRLAREDAWVLNAQTHPPHIELRAPVYAGRGERDAIVRADRTRETVVPNAPIEPRSHAVTCGRRQPVARHQEPRVLVGDRQRITGETVLRSEVPFEISRPEVLGVRSRGRDDAGMLTGPPPPALLHQAATRQAIAGRAARWPPDARVPRCEPLPQLLGPPAGMLTPSGADQLSDVIRDPMGAPVRRSAPVAEGRAPAGVETVEPLYPVFRLMSWRPQSSVIVYSPP